MRRRGARTPAVTNSPMTSSATPSDGQQDGEDRDRARRAAALRDEALAQRGDGRDARGAQRRREAGDDGHDGADEQRDDDRARLDDRAGVRQVGADGLEQRLQALRDERPPSSPTSGPRAEHEALGDDRAQDLAARGAERPQERELARALGDGDREGVEDDERADEERDAGEHEQRRSAGSETWRRSSAWRSASSWPVRTVTLRRQRRGEVFAPKSGSRRGRRRPRSSRAALVAGHPLRLGERADRDDAPAKESTPANFVKPRSCSLRARAGRRR